MMRILVAVSLLLSLTFSLPAHAARDTGRYNEIRKTLDGIDKEYFDLKFDSPVSQEQRKTAIEKLLKAREDAVQSLKEEYNKYPPAERPLDALTLIEDVGNLGRHQIDADKVNEGIATYEEVLALIDKEISGDNERDVSRIYYVSRLGWAYMKSGQYDKARSRAREMQEILQRKPAGMEEFYGTRFYPETDVKVMLDDLKKFAGGQVEEVSQSGENATGDNADEKSAVVAKFEETFKKQAAYRQAEKEIVMRLGKIDATYKGIMKDDTLSDDQKRAKIGGPILEERERELALYRAEMQRILPLNTRSFGYNDDTFSGLCKQLDGLAEHQLQAGKIKEGIATYEEIFPIINEYVANSSRNDVGSVEYLFALGCAYLKAGEYAKARSCAEKIQGCMERHSMDIRARYGTYSNSKALAEVMTAAHERFFDPETAADTILVEVAKGQGATASASLISGKEVYDFVGMAGRYAVVKGFTISQAAQFGDKKNYILNENVGQYEDTILGKPCAVKMEFGKYSGVITDLYITWKPDAKDAVEGAIKKMYGEPTVSENGMWHLWKKPDGLTMALNAPFADSSGSCILAQIQGDPEKVMKTIESSTKTKEEDIASLEKYEKVNPSTGAFRFMLFDLEGGETFDAVKSKLDARGIQYKVREEKLEYVQEAKIFINYDDRILGIPAYIALTFETDRKLLASIYMFWKEARGYLLEVLQGYLVKYFGQPGKKLETEWIWDDQSLYHINLHFGGKDGSTGFGQFVQFKTLGKER